MKFEVSEELEAFRREVRDFVRDNLSPETRSKIEEGRRLVKTDYTDWYKILHKKGWITPAWPVEHGGTGWSPLKRHVFDEEMTLGGAPPVTGGMNMIGPILILYGNEAQQKKYLPAMQRGECWWAQGFSEPGSGSDLASLTTRAVRDGDHYIIKGTKIWTTQASYADMMFALVRTNPDVKPQQGISMILIDMKAPGVSITPIKTIDGGAELFQTFLDDVRVPAENLVGEENKGWGYGKNLLQFERSGIAGVALSKRQMARLKRLAASEKDASGRPLIETPRVRDRIALLEVELLALEYTNLRMLQETQETGPGVESSMLKIKGTEVRQMIYDALYDIVGPYGVPFDNEVMKTGWGENEPIGPAYAATLASNDLDSRKFSIYGGSNEIQRNVLGKSITGL